VQVRFTERDDGQVDVDLGPGWQLMTEALNDCVSSLPPRGAPGRGPSTYWIDVATRGLERALANDDPAPFTAGNATLLRVTGGQIEARYDFDEEAVAGQFIEAGAFRCLLSDWRDLVLHSAARSTSSLPDTYRRNPSASGAT